MNESKGAHACAEIELTVRDKELVMRFRTLTKNEGLQQFSSDTFRQYGLDQWFKDPAHSIGGFFAKMVTAKNPLHRIRHVGYTRSLLPSNNMREIKLYEWTIKP